MRFANPTPIRIGMKAKFDGRRYCVAGRVVLGMEDGGETYYWNEFNLVSEDGHSVTLVYEETERGSEWRLFTLFEPEYSITAADAATKRKGDRLNLDDTDMRVTLVDESRVYHIEGEAPQGVEVGDVAHYFNVETESRMSVVSWTGEEVECYRGVNLSRGLVAGSFNMRTDQFKLAIPPSSHSSFGSLLWGQSADVSGWLTKILVVGIVIVFVLVQLSSARTARRPALPAKISAPRVSLPPGSEGRLNGKTYRLQTHTLMEIGRAGAVFDRHEYQIVDTEGNGALLICGLFPGKNEWHLFIPLDSVEPLTPLQAAALRVGDPVSVEGSITPVIELFQCTVRQTESSTLSGEKPETIRYGVVARSSQNLLLVRWNESGITFHRSSATPLKQVSEAFQKKSVK